MIDTGEHQIGFVLEQFKKSQLRAIGGCPTTGPSCDSMLKELIGSFGTDGTLKGETMAGGGSLLIRTDHGDLMASPGCCCSERADAFGEDSVVVADQDPHGTACSAGNLGGLAAYSQLPLVKSP